MVDIWYNQLTKQVFALRIILYLLISFFIRVINNMVDINCMVRINVYND